jgi:hypothetical protein
MLEPNSPLASETPLKLEAKVTRPPLMYLVGTQRRKKKHVNVQNVNEDKKLMSAIKKFGKPLFPPGFPSHSYCRSSAPPRH